MGGNCISMNLEGKQTVLFLSYGKPTCAVLANVKVSFVLALCLDQVKKKFLLLFF